ncbi:MAG: hypothetical protein FOGNACKC_00724 [Anaerolineae bacterium]|nr:hypothetical protein [Anaerolineae bacterium]
MLRIVNLEEIQGLLLQVPELVDRLDRYDPGYVEGLKEWFQNVESVLGKNRIAFAGNVAALRAMLYSVENGVIPEGYEFKKRLSRRKIIKAVSSDILRQGTELVLRAIQADKARVSEAEQFALQLIALATYRGLIKDPTSVDDWMGYLKTVWQSMSADQETQPGTVRLLGLVTPNDALVILDRLITAALVNPLNNNT